MLTFVITILVLSLAFTLLNTLSLPKIKSIQPGSKQSTPWSSVNIYVPLRNEERNVPVLISNLKKLSYPELTIYLLDDGSTDKTGTLIEELTSGDTRFHLLNGGHLPEGWVGKVHACYQLSRHGNSEYALFMDADVTLAPMTIESMVMSFEPGTGLITGFPRCPVKGILGHLLVPMQHFVVHFHLPVLLANLTVYPPATAAHGAFMMFRRESYDHIGGHRSVKDSLVEDVHISRELKKSGYRVKLANITSLVTCDMYNSDQEVWEGFSKNMFPGLGRSLLLVLLLTILYTAVYIVPLYWAVLGITGTLPAVYFIPFLLGVLQKAVVDFATGQKKWIALLMPASAFVTVILLWYSAYLGLFKKGFSWKGRVYK
ncbi:glycosyltransferase [Bacillus sp. H-16]|uniref:glycosyltransferase n=1 Tax=Alteribacter salitolerans TaxID=2912333 RepID=UPI0019640A73|nr:glycosyltransferase family 2 protein [Alteribacter salitolerans]MBM7097219.1 glycosyltransferase [Alteribacter salitolerans]